MTIALHWNPTSLQILGTGTLLADLKWSDFGGLVVTTTWKRSRTKMVRVTKACQTVRHNNKRNRKKRTQALTYTELLASWLLQSCGFGFKMVVKLAKNLQMSIEISPSKYLLRICSPIHPKEPSPRRGATATVAGTHWCDVWNLYYDYYYYHCSLESLWSSVTLMFLDL